MASARTFLIDMNSSRLRRVNDGFVVLSEGGSDRWLGRLGAFDRSTSLQFVATRSHRARVALSNRYARVSSARGSAANVFRSARWLQDARAVRPSVAATSLSLAADERQQNCGEELVSW